MRGASLVLPNPAGYACLAIHIPLAEIHFRSMVASSTPFFPRRQPGCADSDFPFLVILREAITLPLFLSVGLQIRRGTTTIAVSPKSLHPPFSQSVHSDG